MKNHTNRVIKSNDPASPDLASGQLIRYEQTYPDDEIGLVDLWIAMSRRIWLVIGVSVMATLLGGAAALIKPDVYSYTTSLQLARASSGLLESSSTVIAKLNESYIPFILQDFASEGDVISIEAKISRDSDIILLQSRGSLDAEARHLSLHAAVLDRLVMDHDRELEGLRMNLQSERDRLRSLFSEVQGENGLLMERTQWFDERESQLQDQLVLIDGQIEAAEEKRLSVVENGDDAKDMMSLLLIDTEIDRLRQRRFEINEHLLVVIGSQRDELGLRSLENARLQMEFHERLQAANAKLDSLKATHALTPTLRSSGPSGTRKALVVMTAAALGIALGIFAAFFAEFISRVRERRSTDERKQVKVT